METPTPGAQRAPGSRRLALILLLLVTAAALALCALSVRASRSLREENLLLEQQSRDLADRAGALEQQVAQLQSELTELEELRDTLYPEAQHPAYQDLYPDLYVEGKSAGTFSEKTVFLTFDDGPSACTATILNTLERENVKATFFVVGADTPARREWLQRIAQAGHTIGVHSASHSYKKIYASVEAYLDDFYQVYQMVLESTGTPPTIFRFPGGSVNSYNKAIYEEIITEMLRRGFLYYDWNVSSQDAVSPSLTAQQVYANVVNGAAGQSRCIVLMHDAGARRTTAEALPDIISTLRQKGYSFAALSRDEQPFTFGYLKPSL